MSTDTVTIDGEVYDRREVYDWLLAHDLPADLVPADGAVHIDRDAGTVSVRYLACGRDGQPMIHRAADRHLLTEWMQGRYRLYPPEPAKVDVPA